MNEKNQQPIAGFFSPRKKRPLSANGLCHESRCSWIAGIEIHAITKHNMALHFIPHGQPSQQSLFEVFREIQKSAPCDVLSQAEKGNEQNDVMTIESRDDMLIITTARPVFLLDEMRRFELIREHTYRDCCDELRCAQERFQKKALSEGMLATK